MKRTPLKPGKPPGRRVGLRPMSPKKRRERRRAQPVVDAVMARDGGCVLRRHQGEIGECWGPLTPHHLRKQRAGGPWHPDNLVVLCAGHNGWVEDFPRVAWLMGLVVRDGETQLDAWEQMRLRGLPVGDPADVPLDDAGVVRVSAPALLVAAIGAVALLLTVWATADGVVSDMEPCTGSGPLATSERTC